VTSLLLALAHFRPQEACLLALAHFRPLQLNCFLPLARLRLVETEVGLVGFPDLGFEEAIAGLVVQADFVLTLTFGGLFFLALAAAASLPEGSFQVL